MLLYQYINFNCYVKKWMNKTMTLEDSVNLHISISHLPTLQCQVMVVTLHRICLSYAH
jgi:hypothetical protein